MANIYSKVRNRFSLSSILSFKGCPMGFKSVTPLPPPLITIISQDVLMNLCECKNGYDLSYGQANCLWNGAGYWHLQEKLSAPPSFPTSTFLAPTNFLCNFLSCVKLFLFSTSWPQNLVLYTSKVLGSEWLKSWVERVQLALLTFRCLINGWYIISSDATL